jgi:hypothetical protein
MRFFTPELYLRFNSRERKQALRADADWEEAVRRYDSHLEELKEKMPSQVKKLTEMCLHDAEIMGEQEEALGGAYYTFFDYPAPFPLPFWTEVAALSMKLGNEIVSLFYCLYDHMQVHRGPEDWPLSKERVHWLYDEVDLAVKQRGPFIHRILLSSGIVLEIPFVTVFIHRFSLPAIESKKLPR